MPAKARTRAFSEVTYEKIDPSARSYDQNRVEKNSNRACGRRTPLPTADFDPRRRACFAWFEDEVDEFIEARRAARDRVRAGKPAHWRRRVEA
jgi:hypothetical protein